MLLMILSAIAGAPPFCEKGIDSAAAISTNRSKQIQTNGLFHFMTKCSNKTLQTPWGI